MKKGIAELLEIWDMDAEATRALEGRRLYPWPDIESTDTDFLYVYSTRFDKLFRMGCGLDWTGSYTVDRIVAGLTLPWNKELPELGLRWSFSYGLVHDGQTVPLVKRLRDVGIKRGDTVQVSINAVYEDLYMKEVEALWDTSKMYELGSAMRRQAELRAAIAARGPLSRQRLREIANSCFAHV